MSIRLLITLFIIDYQYCIDECIVCLLFCDLLYENSLPSEKNH